MTGKSRVRHCLGRLSFLGRVGLFLLPQCAAISDFGVHQCESNADCAGVEAGIWRCEASRCLPGCVSNEHCASHDPRAPICSEPAGQCVSLTTETGECYASAGFDPASASLLTARDMVVIGAFAPTLRSSMWLTLQLATTEINAQWRAAQPSFGKPLVTVLCQDSFSSIDAGMDHLVHRLGAVALLASLEQRSLKTAIESASTNGLALFLSPGDRDSWDDSSDQAALVWYRGSDYKDVVPAYPALIQQALSAAQAAGRDASELRVARLVSEATEDQDLARAVTELIAAGGVGEDELARAGRSRRFDLPEGPTDALEQSLLDYEPDLILVFAGGLGVVSPYAGRASVIGRLEMLGASKPNFRPFYILGPRNATDPSLSVLAMGNESFRARAIGLRAERALDPNIALPLSRRFNQAFPSLPPARAWSPAFGAYDSLYYLAYSVAAASVAAGVAIPTADSVAEGLARITDTNGAPVEMAVPDGLSAVLMPDNGASRYDLYGTTGPASFDGDQHTRRGGERVYCWTDDGLLTDIATYDEGRRDLTVSPSNCALALFPLEAR